MFIFLILIQLLREMWVFLVENLRIDFEDQLVQAFSPSAWKFLITRIKPQCFCILCVNHSGEYKGKKRYRALLPLKQLMPEASAPSHGFNHNRPFFIFSLLLYLYYQQDNLQEDVNFSSPGPVQDSLLVLSLSLSEALIQSFCFCFFKLFSFIKYRGKQGIIFSRKLPHVHGRDVMISGLLTSPEVFNGLE